MSSFLQDPAADTESCLTCGHSCLCTLSALAVLARRLCCNSCVLMWLFSVRFMHWQAEELDPEFAAALAATEDAFNIPRESAGMQSFCMSLVVSPQKRASRCPVVYLDERLRCPVPNW